MRHVGWHYQIWCQICRNDTKAKRNIRFNVLPSSLGSFESDVRKKGKKTHKLRQLDINIIFSLHTVYLDELFGIPNPASAKRIKEDKMFCKCKYTTLH